MSNFLLLPKNIFLSLLITFLACCLSEIQASAENKIILGIDLGNENSVLCAAERGGVDLIVNEISARQTPSAILFGNDRRYFGEHSTSKATSSPKAYVSQFRRLVGSGESTEVKLNGKSIQLAASQILSMYIGHLEKIACREKNGRVSSCVISVPSYFGPEERAAIIDAGQIHGIAISEIINDGTALALAYGLFRKAAQLGPKEKQNVIFVDFGHSCLQATICQYTANGAKILSHHFSVEAAGYALDEMLFNHFKEELASIDFDSNPKAALRLKNACTRLKKTLSANTEASAMVECIDGDIDAVCKLKREDFEKMMLTAGIGESVLSTCWKSLESAGLKIQDISSVEVVGGSSYIPYLSKALSVALQSCDEQLEEKNLPPVRRSLNAGEAVATGCALRAAMTSPLMKVRPYKLVDCLGGNQAISISWGGYNCKNGGFLDINPDTSIPCKKMMEIPVTSKDFELRITAAHSTPVKQDGEDFLELAVKLHPDDKKHLELSKATPGLIKAVAGYSVNGPFIKDPYLEVREELKGQQEDNDAITLATDEEKSKADDESSEENKDYKYKTAKLDIKFMKTVGLTEKELNHAKQVEKTFDECDRAVIQCMDAKNSLENYVYEARDSFGEYGELKSFLSSNTLNQFHKILDETEEWLYERQTYPINVYEKRLNALKEVSSKATRLKSEREDVEQELDNSESILQSVLKDISSIPDFPSEQLEPLCMEIEEAQQWVTQTKCQINEVPFYKSLPIQKLDICKKVSKIVESCKVMQQECKIPEETCEGQLSDVQQKKSQ